MAAVTLQIEDLVDAGTDEHMVATSHPLTEPQSQQEGPQVVEGHVGLGTRSMYQRFGPLQPSHVDDDTIVTRTSGGVSASS